MLHLETVAGCQQIKATSELITNIQAHPTNYTDITVKLKKNCCSTEYLGNITGDNITPCDTHYKVVLPWSPGNLSIIDWVFINTVTSQSVTVPINLVVQSGCDNSVALSQPAFDGNYAQASSCNVNDNVPNALEWIWDYNCANTDTGNWIPYKVHYSYLVGQVILDAPFIPVSTDSNLILNNLNLSGDGLFILPSILGDTVKSFSYGVYSIEVIAKLDGGSTVTETNCFFADCSAACEVANYIKDKDREEQIEVLMLHYGLIEGSNCGCNCSELCEFWEELFNRAIKKDTDSLTTNLSTCGCS